VEIFAAQGATTPAVAKFTAGVIDTGGALTCEYLRKFSKKLD
jgi:hypothetical protein